MYALSAVTRSGQLSAAVQQPPAPTGLRHRPLDHYLSHHLPKERAGRITAEFMLLLLDSKLGSSLGASRLSLVIAAKCCMVPNSCPLEPYSHSSYS